LVPLDESDPETFKEDSTWVLARVRDFIILHYCPTQRRDGELWRCMATMELPPTLARKIELWRRFGVLHQYDEEGFDATSWLAIHAGMRHWPEALDPVLDEVGRDVAGQALARRRQAVAESVDRLPTHHRFLTDVLG
jgi:hypothetical protein